MNNPEKVNRGTYKDSEVDKEIFKRIIDIQDLLEEVIIKLIKSADSLSSTSFGKGSSDEHR
jgi:hypothetical protein